MKIFLDTADLDEIRRAADAGLIDGITTNPSLVAQVAGERDPKEIYLEICEAVDGPVSLEVIGLDRDTMVAEGRKLAAIHENAVVKVPLIESGLKACRDLVSERGEGQRHPLLLGVSGPPGGQGGSDVRVALRGSDRRHLGCRHGPDPSDSTGVRQLRLRDGDPGRLDPASGTRRGLDDDRR